MNHFSLWLLALGLGIGAGSAAEEAPVYRYFDMGTADSPVASECCRVTAQTVFSPTTGFGWERAAESDFDRPGARPLTPLLRDGVFSSAEMTFHLTLPNGRYYLRVWVGDPRQTRQEMAIEANGQAFATGLTTRYTSWLGYPTSLLVAGQVEVTAGRLSLRFHGGKPGNSVQAIQVIPEVPSPVALREGELTVASDDPAVAEGLVAYRRGDYEAALRAWEQVADLTLRAELACWVAGRLDYAGDEMALLHRIRQWLYQALRQNPKDAVARRRREVVEDLLTARLYFRTPFYSHTTGKLGVGAGQRQRMAGNLYRQIPEGDPFYYRACFDLGRLHYWLWREGGAASERQLAEQFFKKVQPAYPQHRLVRMYLGESVDWGTEYTEGTEGAPEWAIKQREAMCRVIDVIRYWVEERQIANGEFGGGWGDDVEMMRWWTPAVVAANDPVAIRGMKRLADGIWEESGIIANGFNRSVADVQHSAEPTSDTQPAMVGIEYGNPVYLERCMQTIRLMDTLWTGINAYGHRHFKSSSIGAYQIDTTPPETVDLPYHARATKPGLWVAWYNAHPRVLQLFREWGDAWVEDTLRHDRGKPLGVVPAAIAFETEQLGGYGPNWHHPDLYWGYFNFPGGVQLLFEQLLGTYALTGDNKYLLPIECAIDLARRRWKGEKMEEGEGSLGWAARAFQGGGFRDAYAKWRLLSGQTQYDDYLREYGSPYLKWYLTGDKRHLVEGCEASIRSTRYNFELLTSEVRYTDRVAVGGTAHLFAMYTGGAGNPTYYPTWAVTWVNTTKNFAALVLEADRRHVKVLAHNFEPQARRVGLRLWQVELGTYELRRGPDANQDDALDAVEERSRVRVDERGAVAWCTLPARQLQVIEIAQVQAAPPRPRHLPDVALSRRDIAFLPPHPAAGEKVLIRVTVHNIGSAEARNIAVHFLTGEPEKEQIGRCEIPSLPAPLDLQPQTATAWAVYSVPERPVSIVVSVEFSGPEITRKNNSLEHTLVPSREPHAEFARIFWPGTLNDTLAPVWIECAEAFLTGQTFPEPRVRILEGRLALAERAARREGERATIASLRQFLLKHTK